MRNIYIVAAWLNQKGSVSALCQEHALNPLAMSTGNSSINRSCIHTFSLDKAEEMLGIGADDLAGTTPKAALQLGTNGSPGIDAEKVFKMPLRIQVLEAIGEEEALKKGILNRNKHTGEIMGAEANHKKDRENREPVFYQGKAVYRKSMLAPNDLTRYGDSIPEYTVSEAAIPVTAPEEANGPELLF